MHWRQLLIWIPLPFHLFFSHSIPWTQQSLRTHQQFKKSVSHVRPPPPSVLPCKSTSTSFISYCFIDITEVSGKLPFYLIRILWLFLSLTSGAFANFENLQYGEKWAKNFGLLNSTLYTGWMHSGRLLWQFKWMFRNRQKTFVRKCLQNPPTLHFFFSDFIYIAIRTIHFISQVK